MYKQIVTHLNSKEEQGQNGKITPFEFTYRRRGKKNKESSGERNGILGVS